MLLATVETSLSCSYMREQHLGTCYSTSCLEFRWSNKSWCFGLTYRKKRKRKRLCCSRSDQACRTWSQKAVARYDSVHWRPCSRPINKVTRYGRNGRHDKRLSLQNFETMLILCDLSTCIFYISLPGITFVWLLISNCAWIFNSFSTLTL